MSWLADILNGDKKVWKKIRKAGYKTARGYIASELKLPVAAITRNDNVPDLTVDDLVSLLKGMQALETRVKDTPVAAELKGLLGRFLVGY